MSDRYSDYPDRPDLVVCRDCSSRSHLAAIRRDEIEEHDRGHAEFDPNWRDQERG